MDTQLLKSESTAWIENLALEELNMEESGVIHFSDHLSPEFHLEESSIQFVEQLKEHFETFIVKFNLYRGNQQGLIKVFKISNTVNDFMLFRNSLKLIVTRKSNDLISIYLMSNTGGTYAPRISSQKSTPLTGHDIKAHVGPFNDITWRFNGEMINIHSLVRHYLTEFIRQSSR